ncbi:MAG: hypothetical protein AMXMBFR78_18280 [Rubrivivax sp.]
MIDEDGRSTAAEMRLPAALESAALRKFFDDDILPLAKRLKIVAAGATSSGLFNEIQQQKRRTGGGSTVCGGASAAVDAARSVVALAAAWLVADQVALRPEGATRLDVRVEVASNLALAYGYLLALDMDRQTRVKRATTGRRKVGESSLEKVRQAAQEHRGKRSRAQAAPLIAEKVNLSYGRVQKLLSKLYTGTAWSDPSSDASADSSR